MLSSILILLSALNVSALTTVELLDRCARIADPGLRLSCYDGVARQLVSLPNKTGDVLQAKPSPDVLQSELRIDRERKDYSLTLQDFINLIHKARMEDGTPIQVLGWQRTKQQYSLWLDLHGGTRLLFDHYSDDTRNVSVLAPVNTESGVVDPEIFIMSIASMTPDE